MARGTEAVEQFAQRRNANLPDALEVVVHGAAADSGGTNEGRDIVDVEPMCQLALVRYADHRVTSYYKNAFGRSAANNPIDVRRIWNWTCNLVPAAQDEVAQPEDVIRLRFGADLPVSDQRLPLESDINKLRGLQMQCFTGKVIVITGAASGIGLATAQRIAQESGKLVLVDVAATALEQAAATLDCSDVTLVSADVSQEGEVQAYVREAIAKHGRIDGFFNNAGVVGRQGEPTDSYGTDEYRRVLSVNLDGVFYGMAEVLKVMKEQRSGSIVNTASVGGFRGIGYQSAYAASKMGVIGLTNNAVVEYGQFGIQINVIAPGSIMTPMVERGLRRLAGDDWQKAGEKFVENNPMRRSGTPEEVAALVAFLLSGEAGL